MSNSSPIYFWGNLQIRESLHHFFGEVRPLSSQGKEFAEALRNSLPPVPLPPPVFKSVDDVRADIQAISHISTIYVDVSASQDFKEYKQFIRELVGWQIHKGNLKRLIAIDNKERGSWYSPTVADVETLLQLSFDSATYLRGLLSSDDKALLVTDQQGIDQLEDFPKENMILIKFSDSQLPELIA